MCSPSNGRRAIECEGRIGKSHRTDDLRHPVGQRMRQSPEHLPVLDLRHRRRPRGTVLIGSAGHAAGRRAPRSSRSSVRGLEDLRRSAGAARRGCGPGRRCGRSVDRRPSSGAPSASAKLLELLVIADREHDMAVGDGEHVLRLDVRVLVAARGSAPCRRRDSSSPGWRARRPARRACARSMCSPSPVSAAVRQRGEHGDRGVHARHDVDDRHADLLRPPPGASSRSPVTLISPPMAWIMKS